ncbi:MAG: cellulose binding domain-containing protein, partial [Candidatus Thiodiazotropha sp.]
MENINDWGAGFQGQVTITNTGSSEINGWTLSFDADFEIQQIWNAGIVSHNGTQYVLESVGYNDVIASNGSTEFGFIAAPGGSSMPDLFIVNGEETNGDSEATPTPTPTPTVTPTPTDTPTATPTPTPTPTTDASSCPTDLVGWATVDGGTTGGGDAEPQQVTSMDE